MLEVKVDSLLLAEETIPFRPRMRSKAIATVLIGDEYLQSWRDYSSESWHRYAEKHDYDLILFQKPLDTSDFAKSRSIHWQKLLVLEQTELSRYKRVVWLDSDILINVDRAPCIVSQCPEELVGVSLNGNFQDEASVELRRMRSLQIISEAMPNWTADVAGKAYDRYYEQYGLPRISELRFNTGVMVLSPEHHSQFLRDTYDSHGKDAFDKDQTALSYELARQKMFHHLDPQFNAQVGDFLLLHYPFLFFRGETIMELGRNLDFALLCGACLFNIFEKSFFYHGCGSNWNLSLLIEFMKSPYWVDRDYRTLARRIWGPKK